MTTFPAVFVIAVTLGGPLHLLPHRLLEVTVALLFAAFACVAAVAAIRD